MASSNSENSFELVSRTNSNTSPSTSKSHKDHKMGKAVKVAAIQAEPAWNDLQGGVTKSISLIQEAAKNGANVVGFPEVFIPGYPW